MSFKGPEINQIPPGWKTVEELRDNLVEYMLLQSPYKELSGHDMPEEMVDQMMASMEKLALSIFHEFTPTPENNGVEVKTRRSITGKGTEKEPVELTGDKDGVSKFSYYGTGADGQRTFHNLSDYFKVEKGYLDNLQSRIIAVVFEKEFERIPIGLNNLKVYRYREIIAGSGNYKAFDVKHYFKVDTIPGPYGFTLYIDESEPLPGVIIEYLFY